MSVSPVSSNSNTDPTSQDSSVSARIPEKVLGQNDFLKLLTVQLQSQDPMKPMDDTSFISQMSSFSSLQAMQQMSTSVSSLNSGQQLVTAQSLLGKTVHLVDSNKTEVSGEVTSVYSDGTNSPQIEVNGQSYDLSTVRTIDLGNSNTTTTQNQ